MVTRSSSISSECAETSGTIQGGRGTSFGCRIGGLRIAGAQEFMYWSSLWIRRSGVTLKNGRIGVEESAGNEESQEVRYCRAQQSSIFLFGCGTRLGVAYEVLMPEVVRPLNTICTKSVDRSLRSLASISMAFSCGDFRPPTSYKDT